MKDRIMFYDSGHSYYLNGIRVPSVGQVIHRLFNDFEADYWLTYKAVKDVFPKEFDRIKSETKPKINVQSSQDSLNRLLNPILTSASSEQLKSFREARITYRHAWDYKRDTAAFKGSRFHKQEEDASRALGARMNPWTAELVPHVNSVMDLSECDNYALTERLEDLKDGFYTELLIFDHELGICGQADLVWIDTIGGKRVVYISDFKTNEKKPPKTDLKRMVDPFGYLYDSKHEHYRVQISLYAYMMERAGFHVEHIAYEWIKNYNPESAQLIELKYDSLEISKMVDYALNY